MVDPYDAQHKHRGVDKFQHGVGCQGWEEEMQVEMATNDIKRDMPLTLEPEQFSELHLRHQKK